MHEISNPPPLPPRPCPNPEAHYSRAWKKLILRRRCPLCKTKAPCIDPALPMVNRRKKVAAARGEGRTQVTERRVLRYDRYSTAQHSTVQDRTGQGRTEQGRAGQGTAGQGRAGQDTRGQGRTRPDRTGQIACQNKARESSEPAQKHTDGGGQYVRRRHDARGRKKLPSSSLVILRDWAVISRRFDVIRSRDVQAGSELARKRNFTRVPGRGSSQHNKELVDGNCLWRTCTFFEGKPRSGALTRCAVIGVKIVPHLLRHETNNTTAKYPPLQHFQGAQASIGATTAAVPGLAIRSL